MKLKISILSLVFIAAVAHAATNDLTGLLQKGLFEEEANRDLDAAISNYQTLAGQFDKDRQTAATAIFRLGECYRKLGKTNEAAAQYQRILRDFSDQQTLATLSRQNLTGLGVGGSSQQTVQSQNPSLDMQALQQQMIEAEALLAQNETTLKQLKSMNSNDLRKALPSLIPDDQFNTLMKELDLAQQQLINLRNDYGQDHPKYQSAEALLKNLDQKINDRVDGILLGLQAKVNAETAYLDALKSKSQNAAPYGASSSANGQDAIDQLRQHLSATQAQLDRDMEQLNERLSRYVPTNPNVVEMQRRVDAEKASLESLAAQLERAEASRVSNTSASVTDEEQQEIRRIQLMIQDSPDLINSSDANGETPLQMAAQKGQLVVARYLLEHGANVDVMGNRTRDGTPLNIAAENGHKAMAELLLSRGADVNGTGIFNPLYRAVSKDYPEVVGVLLANKADVNFETYDSKNTALSIAAIKNETNLVQLLLSHGAHVDAKNKDGHTPLFLAATDNSVDAARILLASGADINARDNNGETPLHGAAFYGHPEIISFLIKAGANVDTTNFHNAAPLLLAVANNRVETTRVLLGHKADPNHIGTIPSWTPPIPGYGRSDWTAAPVYFAVALTNNEILSALLDHGANPNGNFDKAWIPLTSAMNANYVDGVQLLLDHGANPAGSPKAEESPLNEAVVQRRDPRIIKALLDKGADPNVPGKNGYTPLMSAIDPDVVRWLVQHKADVNARTKSGLTALMVGHQNVWPEPPEKDIILLTNGANPDLQENDGNTALHQAVRTGQTNIIAALLDYKANPNIQNNDGLTPLDIALSQAKPHTMGQWFLSEQTAQQIADMLNKASGLANLPKRNRIEVRGPNYSDAVFTKDSHDWNHFSLLELVARQYGLLSTQSSGSWSSTAKGARWALWSGYSLPFPDFKNVIIYRRSGDDPKQKAIAVNVEDILNSGDCSRDVVLEWGDVVEIPEADHPVEQRWEGLDEPAFKALTNCVSRQVTLKIKGETTTLKLSPEIIFNNFVVGDKFMLIHTSFMLRSALDNTKLLRVSSDLAHVKVTRHDPITNKTQEWTIDCTSPGDTDLWLRDGDVIDVPEK